MCPSHGCHHREQADGRACLAKSSREQVSWARGQGRMLVWSSCSALPNKEFLFLDGLCSRLVQPLENPDGTVQVFGSRADSASVSVLPIWKLTLAMDLWIPACN